ncbi:beta-class carbonic anhydrase [Robertmurraya massiliosenegalensis]|uniref:beta-class carbonic anhydrase n=1 Tax=Robertmurraya massiliosenegalensis TaxID=1287657 RepID=UPI0002DAF3C7|nr:carbonic anhydrase [Robertmurraya massiliosenegalensis]
MKLLDEILQHNEEFVKEKKYEAYSTTKFPNKRMVIVTCMDTRLTELLPKALNIGNGDVKLVKNAGALVSHPFGSIMRSILVAVYQLQADEVLVIGHHDCGMAGMKADEMIENMKERGIKEETLEMLTYSGINVTKWLKGFQDVSESVSHSVEMIKKHPLLAKDIPVHGLVIDPDTGKLDLVIDGYKEEL